MINKLLDCLRALDLSSFTEDDINDILDGRDDDDFDREWCRANSEIESLKNEDNYTDIQEAEHDEICRQAFFIIEDKISSELSDYISDDFGLIYDSIATAYQDPWLSRLIEAYQNGSIPHGEI